MQSVNVIIIMLLDVCESNFILRKLLQKTKNWNYF